ncbi:MAG TPA: metallophosphoesterase, partial [Solirubrobacterales bacterium]|nr:metallophosphoesterase [Solirubrobacterales bacterium]
MRTAIISDLHLGVASVEDVLRDPAVRRLLLAEIAGADRVVLLGDAIELRNLPLGPSLERSRPFFEELGEAIGDVEVILVPGNHDHRLAEPLLDELSIAGERKIGLEHHGAPSPGPTALVDQWLGPARLKIAYPGIWLREDVYATHGHYMDVHLTLPRAECVAAALMVRLSRPLPAQATPSDYERVLRPLYGFAYGLAQVLPIKRRRNGPFEHAWEVLAGEERRRTLGTRAARAGFPLAVGGLNGLLRTDFEPDVTPPAIFRSGVVAGTELATRLGLDDVHVINGHTHRGGPLPDEPEWPLPGGGRLHNTGSWVFATAFHQPGRPPNSYWPGTVTWLEDNDPPRRIQLLHNYSHEEMSDLIKSNGSRAG